MDDFERDFMSQVRSGAPVPSAQGTVAPKRQIDKRWLVLGGLIVLLVGASIILAIISAAKQPDADFALKLDGDRPYTKKVTGQWRCSSTLGPVGDESQAELPEDLDEIMLSGKELAIISLMEDGTYVHEYANGDAEAGKYVQKGNSLKMTKLSFSTNGEYRMGNENEYGYDMFYMTDGKLALLESGTSAVAYVCE